MLFLPVNGSGIFPEQPHCSRWDGDIISGQRTPSDSMVISMEKMLSIVPPDITMACCLFTDTHTHQCVRMVYPPISLNNQNTPLKYYLPLGGPNQENLFVTPCDKSHQLFTKLQCQNPVRHQVNKGESRPFKNNHHSKFEVPTHKQLFRVYSSTRLFLIF